MLTVGFLSENIFEVFDVEAHGAHCRIVKRNRNNSSDANSDDNFTTAKILPQKFITRDHS